MKTLPELQAALPGWHVKPHGQSALVAYCLPPVERRRLADHAANYCELHDAAGSVSAVLSAGAMAAPIKPEDPQ